MFEVIAQLLNSLVYIDYKYKFKGNSIKNRLSLFILVSIRVSVYHLTRDAGPKPHIRVFSASPRKTRTGPTS